MLLEEIEVEARKQEILKRAEQNEVSEELAAKFVKYSKNIMLRRLMIQRQVDYYVNHIEESNIISRRISRGESLQQPHKSEKLVQDKPVLSIESYEISDVESIQNLASKAEHYINMIKQMNEEEDENELQQRLFGNNFRCKSFYQSYNMFDSIEFQNCFLAERRAKHFLSMFAPQLLASSPSQ